MSHMAHGTVHHHGQWILHPIWNHWGEKEGHIWCSAKGLEWNHRQTEVRGMKAIWESEPLSPIARTIKIIPNHLKWPVIPMICMQSTSNSVIDNTSMPLLQAPSSNSIACGAALPLYPRPQQRTSNDTSICDITTAFSLPLPQAMMLLKLPLMLQSPQAMAPWPLLPMYICLKWCTHLFTSATAPDVWCHLFLKLMLVRESTMTHTHRSYHNKRVAESSVTHTHKS